VRRCQTPDTHIARCGWFGGLIRWFHFPTQVHRPAPYYTPLSSVDLRRPSLSLESLGCVLRGNSHLKFSTPFTSAASTTTTTTTHPPPLPHDDLKAQRPSRSLSRSTSTSTARRILSNRPSGSRPCAEPWIDCSPFPRRSPPPPFRPHTTIHPSVCPSISLSVCLSVCTSSLLAQTSPHLTSPPRPLALGTLPPPSIRPGPGHKSRIPRCMRLARATTSSHPSAPSANPRRPCEVCRPAPDHDMLYQPYFTSTLRPDGIAATRRPSWILYTSPNSPQSDISRN
jgi:hypothetical protein